jgi:hypothetical protein
MPPQTTDNLLPARLMRAFDRLNAAANKIEMPEWPRSVRIGIDYALRISIAAINSDAEADSFARQCVILGELAAADPPGDPPPTCAAQERAERAGPLHARAFAALGLIRDATAALSRRGDDVGELPAAAMRLLQRGARGERCDEAALALVLRAAENLAHRLGHRLLAADAVPPQTRRSTSH